MENEKFEKYKVALQLLSIEITMQFVIFGIFGTIHTLIIGFVGSTIKGEILYLNWFHFIIGILGLLLIFPWVGTFARNTKAIIFRHAQAREAEPQGWNLEKGHGKDFFEGKCIEIEKEHYRMPSIGRLFTNKRGVYYLICGYSIVYIFIIIVSGPWWCNK